MTIYDCNTTFYSFSSDLDCKSNSPISGRCPVILEYDNNEFNTDDDP